MNRRFVRITYTIAILIQWIKFVIKSKGKKCGYLSTKLRTYVEGRYVANVIIGTLEIDGPGTTMLLNSEVLEKANYSTISKLLINL